MFAEKKNVFPAAGRQGTTPQQELGYALLVGKRKRFQ
jgi:hypothetical protein